MKKTNVMWLCESAIMIAASTVLSMVAIIKMPYGGSVTAFSMVPVILIAYRYGTLRGLATGFVHGLLQLLLGLGDLKGITLASFVVVILLDYVLAFTSLGLGGIFKNKIGESQSLELVSGAALSCAVRYVMHVISGCTVWAGVSIPSADGLKFSLIYNAAYMVPELIVTCAGCYYLGKIINFKSPRLSRAPSKQASVSAVFTALSLLSIVATVVFDALKLFAATQTANGFDIAGVANAPFAVLGLVTALGILLSLFFYYILPKFVKGLKN